MFRADLIMGGDEEQMRRLPVDIENIVSWVNDSKTNKWVYIIGNYCDKIADFRRETPGDFRDKCLNVPVIAEAYRKFDTIEKNKHVHFFLGSLASAIDAEKMVYAMLQSIVKGRQ